MKKTREESHMQPSHSMWCKQQVKKGHEFRFLKEGTDCTPVSVSQLLEIDRPTLRIWVPRESCVWKFMICQNEKNRLWFFYFLFFLCWTLWYQFPDLWKITLVSHLYTTLMRNCLRLVMENGSVYSSYHNIIYHNVPPLHNAHC